MKKGVFFSVDALIAVALIFSVIILSSLFYFNKQQPAQPVYFSSDIVQILSTLKIGEINDPDIKVLINTSGITDLNRTILEQALIFQVQGDEEKATQLLNHTIGGLLPDYYSLGVWIEDYESPVYATSQNPITQLISSKQMVSGIKRDRAIEGLTARAFISNLNERTSSAYAYFGGYEGDGNITKKLILPNMLDNINSAYMELDAGSAFNLYINGLFSGYYLPSGDMRADEWDINETYLENLHTGENNIVLSFAGADQYVGGGYIKVGYTTSELESYYDDGAGKYYFPGIYGAINVYSSFYIPGNLNAMNIHLHYKSNYEVFLNIGDKTVFSYDLAGENIANIPNDELALKLNYSQISSKTVPLKIGIRNVSYYQIGFGGTADSILVTDVSGSMDECGQYNSTSMCDYDCCVGTACPDSYSCQSDTCSDEECGACPYYEESCSYDCCLFGFWCTFEKTCSSDTCIDEECGDCGRWYTPKNHQSYGGQSTAQNHNQWYDTTCTKSKLDVAKEADKEFVDVVLSVDGNRVGLVSYSTSTQSTYSLSDDKVPLYSEIDSYDANGYTCICCGVISATNLLLSQSNETRAKSMLVMSDGEANYECTPHRYSTSQGPVDAIQAACDAHQLHNITVYTVGFGDVSSSAQQTLNDMAECGGGRYAYSNTSNLTTIYQGIGEEITNLSYRYQTIVAFGETEANTTLFPDSYIEFSYTSPSKVYEYGRIPVVIETPRFNNTIAQGAFYIPPGAVVYDAKVTSYSSDKWTDKAMIRDNGNWVSFYNLSYYGDDYYILGDPYIVNIPLGLIKENENQVMISAGISKNSTGGSPDDRVIYTIGIDMGANYTGIFEKAEGCNWFIKFEDGTNTTIPIPFNYTGSKLCYFNETIDCDTDYKSDAVDNSVCSLFKKLDFDNDGELFVKFGPGDLDIDISSVGRIPYMWGPTIVDVRVWK